ncbi:hypothetical protein C7457_1613 [Thermovibrio guaymasensis]|uniref:Uncharacterized protein n=1 Tax=Thermovibrio guaymasensis TaxID=240167 RepID=A0A420W5L3_9BACT|nr:hypothetical protein [Thermovibrio guaymasensis]RKQ60352.1 hypothetical protein C7457_1613 [Thermovibrio guaymasensis]
MERAKKDLKETFEHYLNQGLSEGEALKRTVEEVKERHSEKAFKGALSEFLRELLSSYKPENLTEADPLLTFVESLYQEYEFLKPKLEAFLKKLRGD